MGAEEHRLRGAEERMLVDPSYFSFDHQHFSYLSRGLYLGQLMNWPSFFEREQMLILNSEHFFKRTQETFGLVLDFLGLPGYEFEQAKPKNESRYGPKNLESHNQRFYEYLGVVFGW